MVLYSPDCQLPLASNVKLTIEELRRVLHVSIILNAVILLVRDALLGHVALDNSGDQGGDTHAGRGTATAHLAVEAGRLALAIKRHLHKVCAFLQTLDHTLDESLHRGRQRGLFIGLWCQLYRH